MKPARFNTLARPLAALALLLATSCSFLPFQHEAPASPLIGTWSTADHDKVTFRANEVVVAPDKGPATTMGPADCNGVYKLQYGRMNSAALERAFPSQADLQAKLKQLLVKPEYPVADVTCDRGGTTYLLLDEGRMLAVYRDAGVGGTETYSRL